jgi:hypothetical protein
MFTSFSGQISVLGEASPVLAIPLVPNLIGLDVDAAYIVVGSFSPPIINHVSAPARTHIIGPGPVVSAISPNQGPAAGGTPVTISGSAFQTGAVVRFGSTLATNIVVVSPDTITCTTPPGTAGPANIFITNPDGGNYALPGGFFYVPTLVLTSVDPISAPVGATVTVTGAGMQNGLVLTVGGMAVTPLLLTPVELTFANPPGLPCDTALTVMNPDGQTASLPFNPSPVIAHVATTVGPASGGGTFFLLGDHFYPGTTVTVGGTPATLVTLTQTVMFLIAPPGTPGLAAVVVSSPYGCLTTTSYLYF